MSDTTDRVRKAIDGLYEAFADQPVPSAIAGCSHCYEVGELDALLSKPLRALTPDELSSYATSAFLTAGDVPDYLYLMPRIIDVTIGDDSYWPDLEITGRAIKDSGFASWPPERQRAVIAVFEAYLDQLIHEKKYSMIDGLMCAVGRIDLPLDRFLAKIAASHDAVIGYWEENAGTLEEEKLANAFWEPSRRQAEIVQWFKSPEISRIYGEAYGLKFVQ